MFTIQIVKKKEWLSPRVKLLNCDVRAMIGVSRPLNGFVTSAHRSRGHGGGDGGVLLRADRISRGISPSYRIN